MSFLLVENIWNTRSESFNVFTQKILQVTKYFPSTQKKEEKRFIY